MGVNPKINKYFFQAINHKRLSKIINHNNSYLVTATGGSITQGELVELRLLVTKDNFIKAVDYKIYGCQYIIACCEYLAEIISGRNINSLLAITEQDLINYLQLPEHKVHSALLIADILALAVANARGKIL